MTADAAAATPNPRTLLACLGAMMVGMLGAANNAAIAPASLPARRQSARSTSIR